MIGTRTDKRQIEDIWAVSKAGNIQTQERNTPEDDKDGLRAQNLNGTSHFYGLGIDHRPTPLSYKQMPWTN